MLTLSLQDKIKGAFISIKLFDLHNSFAIKHMGSILPSSTISVNTKQIYFV